MKLSWARKFAANLIPPISIHVWGGTGSQLFAICLLFDLKHRFKFRNVKLVFHNSGVTKRGLDLNYSPITTNISSFDDFNHVSDPNTHSGRESLPLKILLKKLSTLTGIFSQANTATEYKNLRPWILIVRGHYSYRPLSSETIVELMKFLENASGLKFKRGREDALALHYRLGDLMHLKQKSYINEERIRNLLISDPLLHKEKKLLLYSDSPDEALTKVRHLKFFGELELRPNDLISSMFEICSAKKFIGTNSKITLWCAILRHQTDNSLLSFIPKELKNNLILILSSSDKSRNITFY